MSSVANPTAELGAVLGDSLESVHALLAALTHERQALEQHNSAALDQALAEKQDQIAVLARLEAQRQRICGDAGFASDAEGMLALADACADGDTLLSRWQRYCDAANDCEQLNLANGAAIRLRQQQVADNLALLRGSDRDTDTYSPDGSTQSGAGRALTEA